MRSFAKFGLLGVLCAFITATPISAQFFWVGGGGTFPASDYGDYAKTGFLLSAGVGVPLGDQGLGFGAEGFFGQNSHSDISGDKTNPYGVMAELAFDFAGANARQSLYVLGGVGLLVHKYSSDSYDSSSSSGFGVTAGVGYFFPLGSVSGFVEGRLFHSRIESANTMFSGLLAGVGIPFGGGGS